LIENLTSQYEEKLIEVKKESK
jgi:septal ring factor EnvC (AmiA/AmiB activator)